MKLDSGPQRGGTNGSGLRPAARIGWVLAAALAVGGILGVVAPAERRVRAAMAHAHELYELANRNDKMLRSAAGLAAASRRVAHDVSYLAGNRGEGATTLAALELLRGDARRFHLSLESLTPDRSDVSDLESPEATIAVRGAYRDVLAAIADLSKHDVLLEVRAVGLAQNSDYLQTDEIDATIGASIYSSIDSAEREKKNAESDNR